MLDVLAALARDSEEETGGRVPVDVRIPTAEESFPEQWAYEICTALSIAVCCSRRSGKTRGAVRKAARILLTKPGSWCHFVSLVKRNAKKHFFRPLMAELKRLGYKKGADFWPNETDLTIKFANGSWVQALGVDDSAGTNAVQGDRSDWFCIDECHLPNEDVLELLIDIATPMLTDTGGQLELLGLPPELEGGFFDNILKGGKFQVFAWTMFDHDFPRSREAKLADVKQRCEDRGLAIEVIETKGDDGRPRYRPGPGTHVQVLRQYFGVRVADPAKLAYEYQAGRNDYDPATVSWAKVRRHSVGLDLGWGDCDALVVHGWDPEDAERRLRVRFEWAHSTVDVDDLADIVYLVRQVYAPGSWVGDTGGHGATKVVKTLAARLGVTINEKPPNVMVSVRLVNDDYRTARLLHPTVDVETAKVLARLNAQTQPWPRGMPWDDERKERIRKLIIAGTTGAESRLSEEVRKVGRTVNQRTGKAEINKKGFHSDRSEANRYAHHAARHWAAKAPPPEPDIHERRQRAYEERKRRLANPW